MILNLSSLSLGELFVIILHLKRRQNRIRGLPCLPATSTPKMTVALNKTRYLSEDKQLKISAKKFNKLLLKEMWRLTLNESLESFTVCSLIMHA